MNAKYLTVAETAKLIRAALKRAFPGVKFSVRSDSYSGGASVNVNWQDGPTAKMVDAIAKQYAGGRFDGMIDLKYGVYSWLAPDGSATVASNPGTEDGMGSHGAERNWMPSPDCVLVHFGADFVFTHRTMTPAFADHLLAAITRRYGALDLSVKTYHDEATISGDYEAERMVYPFTQRFVTMKAAT